MHAEKHVKKFIKCVNKQFFGDKNDEQRTEIIENGISFLFDKKSDCKINKLVLREINNHVRVFPGQITRGYFATMKSSGWYQFTPENIKLQWYINRYNLAHPDDQLPSFVAIPNHNLGLKCIRLDTESLKELFSIPVKDSKIPKSELWSRYFNVLPIIRDRKNLYFDNAIITNGPYTNFQFIASTTPINTDLPKKIIGQNVSCATGKDFKIATINDNIRQSVRNNEFDVITAIDIGFNNMAGTTSLFSFDNSELSLNYTSKWFRSIAGFMWHKLERERITQVV